MRVEFIEPFVKAGLQVITTYIGAPLSRGPLSVRRSSFASADVNIVAGVSGDVSGSAIYAMPLETALNLASSMMGEIVHTMDELSWSAIAELGNIITGHATRLLYEAGLNCHMTPPTVLRGANIEISTEVHALVVPLDTPSGRFEINVAIEEATTKVSV